jgi:enoyl-CoA hydratase
MNYSTLQFEISNNIAVLKINRPQALNALNSVVFSELNDALDVIQDNTSLKVLIITGEGKAFVAGADIAEMSDKNAVEGKEFSELGQTTFNRFAELNIPVIASVNGFALGGGCELAMACDIRVAGNTAKFGQPEVNLGLIPGYAGTVRLSRLIGLSNAMYLLMTGDIIDANEALRLGLVQKVVPTEELMNEVMALAEKIASKGRVAVQKVKEVTIKGIEMNCSDACQLEAKEFGNLFGNGESGEGMKAFLEKRKPNW